MVFFELCEIHIEGLDPIMCDGIDIKEKSKVERVRYGGSHNAIDFIFGEYDIDFDLIKPKDHAILYDAVRLCREEKKRYTILIMQKPGNDSKPVATHALYDCIFTEGNRKIEGRKETEATMPGMALKGKVLKTEYS